MLCMPVTDKLWVIGCLKKGKTFGYADLAGIVLYLPRPELDFLATI